MAKTPDLAERRPPGRTAGPALPVVPRRSQRATRPGNTPQAQDAHGVVAVHGGRDELRSQRDGVRRGRPCDSARVRPGFRRLEFAAWRPPGRDAERHAQVPPRASPRALAATGGGGAGHRSRPRGPRRRPIVQGRARTGPGAGPAASTADARVVASPFPVGVGDGGPSASQRECRGFTSLCPRQRPRLGRAAGSIGASMRFATRRPLRGVVPEHAVVTSDARPGRIREPDRGLTGVRRTTGLALGELGGLLAAAAARPNAARPVGCPASASASST